MAKLIRFDLPMNGTKVKTLDELSENMTVEILGHYKTGLLEKWLRVRSHSEELAALERIDAGSDADTLRDICTILGVEIDDYIIEALLRPPEEFNGFSVGNLKTANNRVVESVLVSISLDIESSIKHLDSFSIDKTRQQLKALNARISNMKFTKF